MDNKNSILINNKINFSKFNRNDTVQREIYLFWKMLVDQECKKTLMNHFLKLHLDLTKMIISSSMSI